MLPAYCCLCRLLPSSGTSRQGLPSIQNLTQKSMVGSYTSFSQGLAVSIACFIQPVAQEPPPEQEDCNPASKYISLYMAPHT